MKGTDTNEKKAVTSATLCKSSRLLRVYLNQNYIPRKFVF